MDAVRDVRDNKTETMWCLGKYENDDVKKSIVFAGKVFCLAGLSLRVRSKD